MLYIKQPYLIFPGIFIFMQAGGITGKLLGLYLMEDLEYIESTRSLQRMPRFPEVITAAFFETRVSFTCGWKKDG